MYTSLNIFKAHCSFLYLLMHSFEDEANSCFGSFQYKNKINL